MSLTIVSGAAPGVEQGAIEAAVNLALRWSGRAMVDHITSLPPIYRTGLLPTISRDPGMVRRLNCQDADGALVFSTSMVLAGVAAFVDRVTEQMGRAFLHVTLNPALFAGGMATMIGGKAIASNTDRRMVGPEVIAHIQRWIRDNDLARVYVTGPSADDVPGIQGAVRDALIAILEPFAVDEVQQTTRGVLAWRDLIDANMAEVDKHGLHGAQVPDDFGPATSADLLELDAVPEPVDSAEPEATYLPGARPIGPDAETRPHRAPRPQPTEPGDQTA